MPSPPPRRRRHIPQTFLRKLYNVGTTEGTASNNLQACAQFLGQYYDPSDLATFFQQDYKPAVGRKVEKVIGPNDASNPGIEATLDVSVLRVDLCDRVVWPARL